MQTTSLRFPGDLFADFEELHRQLERLFSPRSGASIRAVGAGSFPAINIGATPEAVEIFAFAPGVDPAALDVSVERGLLTIAGERRDELAERDERRTVYAHERATGRFRRVVSLPDDADPDKVNAQYRNGVLRIRIDKHEASRPRRIEISERR